VSDFKDIFGSAMAIHCRGDFRGRLSVADSNPIWLRHLGGLGGQLSSDAVSGDAPSLASAVIDGHDAWRSDVTQFWEGPSASEGLKILTSDRFSVFCVMARLAIPGADIQAWTVDGSDFLPRTGPIFMADGRLKYAIHCDDGGSGAQAESAPIAFDGDYHAHEIHLDAGEGQGVSDGNDVVIPTGGAGAGAGYEATPGYSSLTWGAAGDIFSLGVGAAHDLVEYVLVQGAITNAQKLAARAVLRARYPSIPIA